MRRLVLMSLIACGSNEPATPPTARLDVTPPTGAPPPSPPPQTTPKPCPTTENGDRPGYHSMSGPWVRDCNAPWKREYYRVFTQTEGKVTTAYVIPRPDGTPAMAALCASTNTALRAPLDRYGWCDPAGADPDRVNHMTIEDALAITHHAHRGMKFLGTDGGVWPMPMPDDAKLVCDGSQDPDIREACIYYRRPDPDPREAYDYAIVGNPSERAAIAFADALNRLYGIP